MKKEYIIIGTFLIIIIFVGIGAEKGDWEMDIKGMEEYVEETQEFDYSNPSIRVVSSTIKEDSGSINDAIKKSSKYVVENIEYSSGISVEDCFMETASGVLENKKGDCVSMSRLLVSLLRAQNIPARTVGGCLSKDYTCDVTFATMPFEKAKFTEIKDDFKKRGYLHEWVEAYNGREWVLIESTSGQVFDNQCQDYGFYHYDQDSVERCIIEDEIFIDECRGN